MLLFRGWVFFAFRFTIFQTPKPHNTTDLSTFARTHPTAKLRDKSEHQIWLTSFDSPLLPSLANAKNARNVSSYTIYHPDLLVNIPAMVYFVWHPLFAHSLPSAVRFIGDRLKLILVHTYPQTQKILIADISFNRNFQALHRPFCPNPLVIQMTSKKVTPIIIFGL